MRSGLSLLPLLYWPFINWGVSRRRRMNTQKKLTFSRTSNMRQTCKFPGRKYILNDNERQHNKQLTISSAPTSSLCCVSARPEAAKAEQGQHPVTVSERRINCVSGVTARGLSIEIILFILLRHCVPTNVLDDKVCRISSSQPPSTHPLPRPPPPSKPNTQSLYCILRNSRFSHFSVDGGRLFRQWRESAISNSPPATNNGASETRNSFD